MSSINKIFGAGRLFRASYQGYRWHILLLTVLGVATGTLEGVGANALIPLLSFATAGRDAPPDNFILTFLKQGFSFVGVPFTLRYLLIFVCVLFIARAAASVVSGVITASIVSNYEEKRRTELLRATLAASWPHLLKQKVGYLDTILMLDIKKSAALLEQLVGGIANTGNLVVYVFVAMNISSSITGLTLGLGLASFLLLKPLLEKTRRVSQEMTGTNREVAHLVNENIIGAKTIKALSGEEAVVASGRDLFKKLKHLQIISAILKKIISASSQPLSIIFISVVFAVFYGRPDFNFAAMLAIMYLIQRIFLYFQLLQNSVQGVAEHIPYLESITAYESAARERKEVTTGRAPFSFLHEMTFENVSFSYDEKISLLRDVNFKIRKAEMVGLVGPSGAGKTTIVDLFLRLFDPVKGRIAVDGRNIGEIDLGEWRRRVGYVSQDIFLRNDSFANNIKFYDPAVSDEDMRSAAHMAYIDGVIDRAPKKYSAPLGERGVLLSGGQRQRVALARVLARKPEILILDEATSALDAESEATIREAINTLKGKITMIIIAHRRETLSSCDRLLALEDGRVVEKKYE